MSPRWLRRHAGPEWTAAGQKHVAIDVIRRLEERINRCFEAGALATGCTHEVVKVSPVYAELNLRLSAVADVRSRGPAA